VAVPRTDGTGCANAIVRRSNAKLSNMVNWGKLAQDYSGSLCNALAEVLQPHLFQPFVQ
jgi:hypothetical protein